MLPSIPPGLTRVVRDGIRGRLLLSVSTFVLTVLAVGAAVLGPSFAVAVTNSYVVTRLDEARNQLTGLSWEYRPTQLATRGSTDETTSPAVLAEVQSLAARAVADQTPDQYLPATYQLENEPIVVPGVWTNPEGQRADEAGVAVRLLAKNGGCGEVQLTGRCPAAAGEIAMLAGDAAQDDLEVGDTVDLGSLLGKLTLVGTYLPPTEDDTAAKDFWFDLSQFESRPRQQTRSALIARRPAPYLTAEATLLRLPVDRLVVRAASRLDVTADFTVDDFDALVTAVDEVTLGDEVGATEDLPVPGGTLTEVSLNDIAAMAPEISSERDAAATSIAPAMLAPILVALALLSRLMSASAALRAPELALASLRGVSTRQTWLLGLAEPLTLLVAAVPVGVALGLGSGWALTRWWLYPGLPVPAPWTSWTATALVAVGCAAVAVAATATVFRRTLDTMLTPVTRPQRTSRSALVAILTLLAATIVLPVASLTSGREAPDITDLVLPIVLGLTAGVAATRLVVLAARRAQHLRRWSISPYVASRAVARRSEATLLVLPLAVAVSVSIFGAGVYGAAAAWRSSVAATEAPAATVYSTELSMAAATDLTHELDPDGRWLMSAAVFLSGRYPWVVADTGRLPAVASWPAQWTDESVSTLSADISAAPVPTFTGNEVTLDLRTTGSSAQEATTVELRVRPHGKDPQGVYLGPFDADTTSATADAPCKRGCDLLGLNIGGAAASPTSLAEEYVVGPLAVDGQPAPELLRDGWSATPALRDGTSAQGASEVDVSSGTLTATTAPVGGPRRITLVSVPVPAYRPVVVGRGATEGLNTPRPGIPEARRPPPAAPVAQSESVPLLGPRGVLADYTMTTIAHPQSEYGWEVYLLANEDLPAGVASELASRGIAVSGSLDEVKTRLDATAYALATRLYAIAAAIVLLMAFAGLVVTTATQLPARRTDAASMRVVGVRRRAVLLAVALEAAVILLSGGLAGLVAGLCSQLLVLRTLTLGTIAEATYPRVLAAVDLGYVTTYAAAMVTALGLAAVASAMLTVRGANGGTLRERGR